MEGIGYDFIPDVLSRSDVSSWIKTSDEEAFAATLVLMRKEGLLVGGSSGMCCSPPGSGWTGLGISRKPAMISMSIPPSSDHELHAHLLDT